MDPEVIAQLEAQLRELSEMIANQNSMMKSQMDAMNKMSSSTTAAGNSIKSSTEKTTTSNTKYAEAQEKATTQTGKSEAASKALAAGMGTLSASVSGLIGTFGALGSTLLSAEQGMAKYGKVADAAADGAANLAKSIPIVGGALGGLVGVVGKLAAQIFTDGMKLIDTFVGMRDGITEVAGALPITGENLIKMANNAGYFGERMQILGKITAGVGTGLASLGTTAGEGAVKFMKLAEVTDEQRRQFGRLGISQERLTEMQGQYVKSQEASGLSMQLQTKTASQLRKESLAYVDNMTRLSALTGKQAEQLQAEQDAAASVIQERLEVLKENQQIKQLRAEGRNAEAADIERRQQDRAKFRQELTAAVGPEEAVKIMKIIRSGVYDSSSAAYANLGIDIAKYGDIIRQGGQDAGEAARGLVGELDTGRERMAGALGASTEFISDEGLANLGFNNEAIGRQLTRAGKNYEEASDQAEKDIARKKQEGDDLADMVENVRATERQFQAMYQQFLLDKVMKLSEMLKDFDLFSAVTKNFTSILGGLAAAIAGVVALSAGIAGAGAMLAARAMGGGAAGAGAAGAGGAAAAGGGILSKAGRFAKGLLGKVAVPVMAGMALYDAYKGYTADPNASFGDKLKNAGSSALSGVSFGLLGSSADEIKAAGGQQAMASQLGPQTMSQEQLKELGIDKEGLEKQLNEEQASKRETTQIYQEQQDAASSLIGTTGTLDTTLEATNKSLKIFRDLIEQLNMALGGPDAGTGGGIAPMSMGGMGGGNDPNKILSTIRQMESGNNYTAQNPTSSASGAYQFIDSTWQSLTKKYGIGTEFQKAKDAPPAIQDQIASKHLEEILNQSGGDITKVPTAWFTGNVQGKSSAVSPDQVAAYVQKWMGIYNQMPGGMPGMGNMPGMPGNMGGTVALFRALNQMMSGMGGMGGMGGLGGNAGMALMLAQQLTGKTGASKEVADFLKAGGVGLNPQLEAWCAAYVNSALQQAGLPGSGSAVANSFQNWGSGIPFNKVAPGDVVLETRNKPANMPGGHVGLATGLFTGSKIRMVAGNTGNTVKEYDIPADGDVMVRRAPGLPTAERGGILSGPNSGYPAILHGTEMVVPLNNGRTNNAKAAGLLNQIMNMSGERVGSVGKYNKITESLMQVVNSETTKAIAAVNEANGPMQSMTTEISNSMRKVMEAHNSTMYELTYKLGEMIDALNTSNDVTKKILKKASA